METRHNLRDIALLAGAALLSTGAMTAVAALPLINSAVTRAVVGAATPLASRLYRQELTVASR